MDLGDLRSRLRHAGIRRGLDAISLIPPAFQLGPWSGSGIIFTLHHVRSQEAHAFQPNSLLSITPEFLDIAIRTALECGLIPIRLEDLPAFNEKASKRFFAFTLDDGYRDNAEFAAPVFRRYGVPYTIFVTSGFVQRSCTPWWEIAEAMLRQSQKIRIDCGSGPETIAASTLEEKAAAFRRIASFVNSYDEDVAVARIETAARSVGVDPYILLRELVMDTDELRDLVTRDPLVSLGAHTVSHCNLKRVDAKRLRDEISESAEFVEAVAGRKPTTFAYPYGWSSATGAREAQAIADAGLELAVTTQPGVLQASARRQNHLLPRVSLNGLYQDAKYVRALISGLPFLFRR